MQWWDPPSSGQLFWKACSQAVDSSCCLPFNLRRSLSQLWTKWILHLDAFSPAPQGKSQNWGQSLKSPSKWPKICCGESQNSLKLSFSCISCWSFKTQPGRSHSRELKSTLVTSFCLFFLPPLPRRVEPFARRRQSSFQENTCNYLVHCNAMLKALGMNKMIGERRKRKEEGWGRRWRSELQGGRSGQKVDISPARALPLCIYP